MNRHRMWVLVTLSGLSLALGLASLYTDLYPIGLLTGLMLVSFVPGYGLLCLTPSASSQSWLVQGGAALALSYVVSVILLMILVYLAGAITPAGMLLGYALLLALLVAWSWRSSAPPPLSAGSAACRCLACWPS